jgi:uncharacterized repeat protein (TIGR03843 family)
LSAREPEDTQRRAISRAEVLALLETGQIEPEGLVPWSSNYTFLVTVRGEAGRASAEQLLAIYKPSRGERPLWDFDSGSLCYREVAAFWMSDALGWPNVPPVVVREGPYGSGSVQLYIDADVDEHFFTLREEGGYEEALQQIALFDYVVNNADRKGGHVLKGPDGRLWAIDHGLTFHSDYKLRTVIWDYARQPIPAPWLEDLERLKENLSDRGAPLRRALQGLLTRAEVKAVLPRLDTLLIRQVLPLPVRDWRNVPYPLI